MVKLPVESLYIAQSYIALSESTSIFQLLVYSLSLILKQAINTRLLTEKGSLVMHPNYGTSLADDFGLPILIVNGRQSTMQF